MKELDAFLDQVLYTRLREVNMPYRFIRQIQDDIKCRMLSCLAYWNEIEIRNTILFLSLEEALFYEPQNVQDNIREFVVTTIRNSMLEIPMSDDCHFVKIPEPISSAQVKKITTDAIQYFDKYDMSDLAKKADTISEEKNIYMQAKKKYPLAWDVLYELANLQKEKMKIDRSSDRTHTEKFVQNSNDKIKTTVCNGFTLEFDEALQEIIGEVLADKLNCFYTDCFKMVSRNFEKVLHVLQIILEHEKIFCTCNYYISTQYLEKRSKILRAAHNSEDAVKNLNHKGAPEKIRECIDDMMGNE